MGVAGWTPPNDGKGGSLILFAMGAFSLACLGLSPIYPLPTPYQALFLFAPAFPKGSPDARFTIPCNSDTGLQTSDTRLF